MFYAVRDKLRKSNYSLLIFHLFSLFFIFIPLAIVVFKAFHVTTGYSFKDHVTFTNSLVFVSLLRSIVVAIFTLFFVLIIGYLFAYFLFNVQNRILKIFIVALITSPIWSTFFVKLIGLKSFFDFCNGSINSTGGLFYVVVGLVYINLPTVILSLYNSISHIPKNIINSALDLGHNKAESMFQVIIPYTYKAIISVVFLVFLPSVTTLSVPDFLNKLSGSKMVSQIINGWVSSSGDGDISTNRLSFLVFFFIFLGVIGYVVMKNLAKIVRMWCQKRHG